MLKPKADDIMLFVQVVEAGSFSKVASQQELTNSVVSKRIGRLESSLNIQLLYRSTRKLSLTEGGKTLYKKAKVAAEMLMDAQNAVCGYSENIGGQLKITMPSVSARFVLTDAIAKFCKLYPDIEVDLHVDDRFVNIIEQGFDLAIRTGELEDSSLLARRLVDSHWVIVASPEYLKHHGIPESSADLTNHNCLTYKSEFGNNHHWLFEVDGIDHTEQVNGKFYANDLSSLKQAALSHFGIAYLPHVLVFDDIREGRLVRLLANQSAKKEGIYAVYPKARKPDKKIKLLIEHLRGAYKSKGHYFNH